VTWPRQANGPLMARQPLRPGDQARTIPEKMPLTWDYEVERVTRIELALSAWEAERLPLLGGLTWQMRWSVVAVVDPPSPWLMAR
jgi:hypothetical protein